jgi:hypothetical protein
MYAGHFATSIVFHKLYPNVLPFVFTIGVVFLDIVFGILAYYGVETISENNNAGLISVNLHCNYSHSLIGSIILSSIYGFLSGSFIPAFLSSFSHFIEDWFVHNKDLFLDPYSNIIVGGTSLWSKFPIFSYYFEAILCIFCTIFTSKDISSIIANIYVLYLHWSRRPSVSGGLAKVANLPENVKREILLKAFLKNFCTPAIIIGSILFKNYYDYKN